MDISLATLQATQQSLPKAAPKTEAGQFEDWQRRAIRESAEEFESIFLSEMFKPMFSGAFEGEGLFGGGSGERIFQSLLVQEYAKSVSQTGGVGIADAVERQLLQLQEAGETHSAEPGAKP